MTAYSGIGYLITIRVIQGLAGGLTMPSMTHMITKWCPELERTYLTGIIFSGKYTLSNICSYTLC